MNRSLPCRWPRIGGVALGLLLGCGQPGPDLGSGEADPPSADDGHALVPTHSLDHPHEPDDCTPHRWYLDADNDGYGRVATSVTGCKPPAGYGDFQPGDCDDTDPRWSSHRSQLVTGTPVACWPTGP